MAAYGRGRCALPARPARVALGPAGRRTLRQWLFRPFGAEGRVVLIIDPGVSAVADAKAEPDQVITEVTFQSSAGDLGVFSDLPLVTRSELIRSLRALG